MSGHAQLIAHLLRPVAAAPPSSTYRGCRDCTLTRPGAALSSSDERVLQRTVKILEGLHLDASACRTALREHAR